jgi:hypothetical protein
VHLTAATGGVPAIDVVELSFKYGDLLAFHAHPAHGFSLRLLTGGGSTLLGTLLAEKERNPELIETFRRLVIDKRREQFRAVVARATKRGEIVEGTDPDYVASAIFGSLIARTLGGFEVSDEVIEKTIDAMLVGLLKR